MCTGGKEGTQERASGIKGKSFSLHPLVYRFTQAHILSCLVKCINNFYTCNANTVNIFVYMVDPEEKLHCKNKFAVLANYLVTTVA